MSEFRKPKRQFRKREKSISSDDDDEDHIDEKSVLDETKELQRMRKRQHGVNINDLVVGVVEKKKEKVDPLKMQTGGYVDIKTLKREMANADDVEQIGTSFAAETNQRDEDADMLKYVELELAKQKGMTENEETEQTRIKNPMDALYELPEHIKNITSHSKKTEDMLSNQMLSGIPEIDLGIDQKIQNIEMTEEAKQKLIDERMKKKDSGISDFVPTNMAVNFVQHNRFKIEDHTPKVKKQVVAPKPAPLRVGDAERPNTLQGQQHQKKGDKATDDFHYERFKKQLRRY